MAEDDADVVFGSPDDREIGDVLSDQHTVVKSGGSKHVGVFLSGQLRQFFDRDGVHPPGAQPFRRSGRVHLVE